jgi:hypothetical protein
MGLGCLGVWVLDVPRGKFVDMVLPVLEDLLSSGSGFHVEYPGFAWGVWYA